MDNGVKPGIKTSELWVTIGGTVSVLAAFIALAVIDPAWGKENFKWLLGALAPGVVYGAGRVIQKMAGDGSGRSG